MFNGIPQYSMSNILLSLMQILSSISARSDLPISNTARKQLRIDCEDLRTKYKNKHLLSHDLHIDQMVMYQDSTTKWWYPATITKLCNEPGSYIITTKKRCVQYRKTQDHLKPYQEDEHLSHSNHMQIVKSLNTKSKNNDNLAQSRPKRDMKPPVKLDL